ncbi:hypothetical protein EU99_0161 [Prochlorococcus marinus str. MIT 9321]|uniref:DUF751 domain-containing protein n=1 Tax=Prochlorococcus marinus str. MIT 9401 TaxID=167551 RepID=A0A0A2B0U1_PROMR|nr:DUF751 family protein [Prochlorococcus marinus]KGG05780.1 hypothetical protein EU99_0161 [Prochlorococcus marinus str. MIT 9321]KGG06194.1 hypothetical protein EV00_0494 [Prochlorococcus marinus str. MIT 9322]KGG06767.1 hypothetical protein EV01_1972 [Prochlorococcus marinus str. MIT 9401]
MGEFFSNVARYPKYLISIIVGGLVALLEPLFKNRSNPLTIVGLISSVLSALITVYFVLQAMTNPINLQS